MYLRYYDLKKEPFHITPDPEFLYLSPSHKEALASIIYGIKQRKGFVGIIGAVGVGKTTILRSYLEIADKNHLKIIYIFNARLTFEGLLKTIYQDLDLELTTGDTMTMLNNLYHVLIDEYKQGNNVVLVIDEAQNMPFDTLESLRMLSNLETSKDKLLQIVLLGQPEFEESLNLARFLQLNQRIAIKSRILALTKRESADYIQYRLSKSGAITNRVFTDESVNAIIKEAKGIPRVINILADNALISGFGYQKRPVTAKIVKEVISDHCGKRKKPVLPWVAAACILLALSLTTFFWFTPQGKSLKVGPNNVGLTKTLQSDSPEPALERPMQRALSSNQEHVPRHTEVVVNESPKSMRVKARSQQKGQSQSIVKTVKSGDTSTGPTDIKVDRSDDEMIDRIQRSNPQISDPNLIVRGSQIAFPQDLEGRK